MQHGPLVLTHFFDRAERLFPEKGIVTATGAGREHRSYGEWADRTRRLATVLDQLGISADGRVATFAWNTARHLELYFAAPCSGRVLHTLNIRLFPEQLTYIVDHAEDEVIFVDKSLLGLLMPLAATFSTVKHIVVMDDGVGAIPDDTAGFELLDYEELLAGAEPAEFHVTDEDQAASMCYTSGTTGNPKGVVYSHRSTWLHTAGVLMADSLGACERDRILPVVPMFHANAWGLAHAGVAAGADLIMPGPDLSPTAIVDLIEAERVTVAAGVPTIWMGVLQALDGHDVSSLRAIPCGGSAVPMALSEGYRNKIGLAHHPGVGDDRDQPHRLDRAAEGRARGPARRRAGRVPGHHRPPVPGRRPARRRPGDRRGGAEGRQRAGASCRPPGPGSPGPTTTTTGRLSPSPTTAGSAPATSPPSTPRATCASSTAPRTW